MSNALPLPPRPNLEQYKKLARELQEACQSNESETIRQWAIRWVETLSRLDGPDHWQDARSRNAEAGQIERRWNELKESTRSLANCTLAGAQFFIAREHGFTNWPKFAKHVQEIASANPPVSAFEAAADAIVQGDAVTLRQLLASHPGLVHERSTREHRSTLLHYVSANGVEDFRQKSPKNIVEIANLLLDAGADVNAESEAYGGCTTLGLVATSIHPEKAGVQIDLLKTLLDRGADLNHPSAGGNGHTIVLGCLANGQPAAARFLADLGAPLDPETAAGAGRTDVLQRYFDTADEATLNADRKKLESGFLYACGYGQLEAAQFLLDHGMDVATQNDEGQTALHWAAWGPEVDIIQLLIARGAPVLAKDSRYHAIALDMALWKWNNPSDDENRERGYQAVALLARAGSKLDREHWQDPGKDRSEMLDRIDSDPRMLAALRGEIL